jgi:hypothetical protein
VDGVDDLGVVDALEVDRGDAEVAVPELFGVPRPYRHYRCCIVTGATAPERRCAASQRRWVAWNSIATAALLPFREAVA